jgi:hypothetical protein
MNTPTLTIKAKRITSTILGENIVISAFMPSRSTIAALRTAAGTLVQIDLDDETGLWSNGRTFEVEEVTVSEDDRAVVAVLVS